MSRLAARSELDKLADTLALAPERLDFLEETEARQLRALRVAIYELLFADDAWLFERLGAIATRLPTAVTTRFARRLGPLVSARVAAEMPFARSVAVAMALAPGELADVCAHLDPRRTRDLIAHLPVARVVEVARELADRGDFVTMSRFVDFLSDEAIRGVVEAIEEGALLRVAFYMGSKNRVDHLFHMLAGERLERLVLRAQERPEELLAPLLSLLIHVSYALKRQLGDIAAAQEDAVLDGYVRATQQQRLWPDMLPVVAAMSPAASRKMVNLPVLGEPAVQEGILVAADAHGLWGIVLPLVATMDDANRQAVAGIVARRGEPTLRGAVGAALMGEQWETLLDLVRRMPRARQDEFAAIAAGLGESDPELLERIVVRAASHGFGARMEAGAAQRASDAASGSS